MIRDTYYDDRRICKANEDLQAYTFHYDDIGLFARRYLERMDTAIILFTRWRLWIRFFY